MSYKKLSSSTIPTMNQSILTPPAMTLGTKIALGMLSDAFRTLASSKSRHVLVFSTGTRPLLPCDVMFDEGVLIKGSRGEIFKNSEMGWHFGTGKALLRVLKEACSTLQGI